MESKRIVLIGAGTGIGGLTAAATLARSGHSVTGLEALVYPGGVAGTFCHRGYQLGAASNTEFAREAHRRGWWGVEKTSQRAAIKAD